MLWHGAAAVMDPSIVPPNLWIATVQPLWRCQTQTFPTKIHSVDLNHQKNYSTPFKDEARHQNSWPDWIPESMGSVDILAFWHVITLLASLHFTGYKLPVSFLLLKDKPQYHISPPFPSFPSSPCEHPLCLTGANYLSFQRWSYKYLS